jgi:hypothetical protein
MMIELRGTIPAYIARRIEQVGITKALNIAEVSMTDDLLNAEEVHLVVMVQDKDPIE